MSDQPPRQPRHIVRFAEDGLTQTDNVQAAVSQAQALIATARGTAYDASVKIEEFSAAATTPEARAFAAVMKASFDAVLGRLTSIDETLKGTRLDAASGGKSTTRYNRAFVILGVGGMLVGIVGIVVAVIALAK